MNPDKKLSCALAVFACSLPLVLLPAEEIPLPENLKGHVVYRNGFDSTASLRDPSCKWKIRTNKSAVRPNGLTGSCIAFDPGSIGWHLTGSDLAPGGGGTVSVWFQTGGAPEPGSEISLLYHSRELPPETPKSVGWISMFLKDRLNRTSGQKKTGLYCQAYHLPGSVNLHHAATGDFSREYSPGEWHHAAISCNGKNVAFYLDGKLLKQKTLEQALPAGKAAGGITFGRSIGIGTRFDEFILFDSALDENTIREYYHAVRGILARKELF